MIDTRDPAAVRDAAVLIAREPAGVDEHTLVAAYRDATTRTGPEWRRTTEALLAALSAVRQHTIEGDL